MGKFEVNVDLRARNLGLQVERLAEEVQNEFRKAVEHVAHGAYAKIVSSAQAKLNSSRMDYLKGLTFKKLGTDTYLIGLEGDYPNKLEEGYPPFDMKPGMLASSKTVEVGPRAGLPWVQHSAEDQHKFAHVPFEHKPYSKAPRGSDLNQVLRGLKTFNRQGVQQKLTSIFRDASGRALEGQVARVTSPELPANLQGITKFQKLVKSQAGKEKVQSLYLTWRTVSEHSAGWQHPGWAGAGFFEEAERFVASEIDNIIKVFTKR